MKKTIISAILATTFAGMVFAAGAPVASAATQLDGPKNGSTVVHIQAGGVSLDSVPSFSYGFIDDTEAGFVTNTVTGISPLQVTDLRGASLPWYVTASAGDLTLKDTPGVKLMTTKVSMNVADGEFVTGSANANIYSTDGSQTATVANGGTTINAATKAGDATSALTVASSSTLQAGKYEGAITYTLVDANPSLGG